MLLITVTCCEDVTVWQTVFSKYRFIPEQFTVKVQEPLIPTWLYKRSLPWRSIFNLSVWPRCKTAKAVVHLLRIKYSFTRQEIHIIQLHIIQVVGSSIKTLLWLHETIRDYTSYKWLAHPSNFLRFCLRLGELSRWHGIRSIDDRLKLSCNITRTKYNQTPPAVY